MEMIIRIEGAPVVKKKEEVDIDENLYYRLDLGEYVRLE